MKFETFAIKDLVLCKPDVWKDDRGVFLERYHQQTFNAFGIDCTFVQDNFSRSAKGVLRGLHFQKAPYEQDKLVWVTRGQVFDVAVDLRPLSPTFGKWQGVLLSDEDCSSFFIPKGFAHGFLVLSEQADLCYKTSKHYNKEHDTGIIWNDKTIGIDWPSSKVILSDKDKSLPTLAEIREELVSR